MSESIAASFWRQVDVREMRECWLWQGTLANGYGIYRSGMAHRFAWTFIYGEVPTGLFILHSCDNPQCVNPRHLRAGTHEENSLDKSVLTRVRACMAEQTRAEEIERERMAAFRADCDAVDPVRQSLAGNLRRIRQERGLSMQALADAIGTTKSQVCRWEQVGIPSLRIAAVCAALGVQVSELLS